MTRAKKLKAVQQTCRDSDKMFTPPASILLIDDEPTIHFVVGMFLREAGYFVGDANDGVEGLRMFEAKSWDLVITDRAMPGMGGEQLAEEIRKISADVPLMLITGFLKSETRSELFEEILQKPFKCAGVLATVRRALNRTSRVATPLNRAGGCSCSETPSSPAGGDLAKPLIRDKVARSH